MTGKKKISLSVIIIIFIAIGFFSYFRSDEKKEVKKTEIIVPRRGDISVTISCTGTVEPRNRLEIKPTISGRIEKILVVEGQNVRAGQVLLWMSSEERAALIDAARAQGSSSVKYWEEAYKPIPLIAPITGTVIVRDIEPGQSVTSQSAVLVLSDRLIVRASVDETDIGKVRKGHRAMITLDAYPDTSVSGSVSHISYESTIVNNVTTYEVDIIPDSVPAIFRSGMSANVSIESMGKKGVLLIPVAALKETGPAPSVTVIDPSTGKEREQKISTGISDGSNIEILSGITEKDRIAVVTSGVIVPRKENGKSPFFPSPHKDRKK